MQSVISQTLFYVLLLLCPLLSPPSPSFLHSFILFLFLPPHSPPLLSLSYTLPNFEVPPHYPMIIFKFSSFEYFQLPAIKGYDITTSFGLFQCCLLPVHQIPHTTLFSSTPKQPSYFRIIGKISHLGK